MKNSTEGVLYFGSYEPNYSRNRIIKKGLIANDFKVFDNQASGLLPFRYFKLFRQFLKLQKKINVIIIGFPGHFDVPLAFVLGKLFRKKVFFDIFASTHETYVLDRKVVHKKSFKAKFYYLLDWIGLHLANYVIVDTKAHLNYYQKTYNLNKNKGIVVYVGSDSDYFYPRKVKEETDVLFYGSYQPLQGTEVIIYAASKLPKVKFKMIGEGQTKKITQDLARDLNLKNVEFVNWLPLEKLAEEIAKAKICLGIFGTSQKANVVIPNKVYDYLAFAKPVITCNSDAAQELLKNGKNAILIPAGNHTTLTEAIVNLIKNSRKRQELSRKGNSLFESILENKSLVDNLISEFN